MLPFSTLSMILCFVSILFSHQIYANPSTDKSPRHQKPHWVITATVSDAPLLAPRIHSGVFKARHLRRIFNEEAGRIIELPFYAGDKVKKGDVLARFDARRLQAQLAKAKAYWQQAKTDVQRLKKLSQHQQIGLVSAEALGHAQTQKSIRQAEMDLLILRVEAMTLYAPFSGIISARKVELGDVVSSYQHLISLFNPRHLMIEVTVSAQHLVDLQQGGLAETRIDALGKAYLKAKISRIHPMLDTSSRQGIVEIQLLKLPAKARVGQFCRVRFLTPDSATLSVPYRAVRHDEQGDYVFMLKPDKTIQRQAVTLGVQLADRVEILTGLMVGKEIISQGFLDLKAGMSVNIKQ